MKLNKLFGKVLAIFTVLLFVVLSLSSSMFVKTTSATNVDTCGEDFTYGWNLANTNVDDNRVTINVHSSDSNQTISVTAKTGYQVIDLDLDDNGTGNGNDYSGGNRDHFNPSDLGTIYRYKVEIEKVCATATATATSTTSPAKVYVCKYVGTPGVNETLQTGQNPIEVSVNAIPNGWSIGAYFSDQQGRSYVLATVPQSPAPNASNCPQNGTPTATATATSTSNATATATSTSVATATATATATSTSQPCDGDCNEPTSTPTSTPVATETPNSDLCANIDGIQYSVPEGKHLDASGKNCVEFGVPGVPESGIGGGEVLGASKGQVLGASTMAGTGAVTDAFFNAIFGLGSLLTSFGIMKNGKKKGQN